MTDSLVQRLREAIDETERVASLASQGPWKAWQGRLGLGLGRLEHGVVLPGEVAGSPVSIATASWLDAEHIARHDPAAVLRRCAADRKILDLHAPYERRLVGGKSAVQCEHCADLCHSRSGLACDDPVDAVYPCETIKLVAEAYGVEV